MQDRSVAALVRHQHPLTLPPEASVRDAAEHMRDRRVGAVLVTDAEGALLGIFTGRDAICRVLASDRRAETTRLAEVMTPAPQTLTPGARALDALRLMQDGGFRHVPILAEGRVAGIVSRGDFRACEHARLDEETGFFELLR